MSCTHTKGFRQNFFCLIGSIGWICFIRQRTEPLKRIELIKPIKPDHGPLILNNDLYELSVVIIARYDTIIIT